jgi:hypothetical protein
MRDRDMIARQHRRLLRGWFRRLDLEWPKCVGDAYDLLPPISVSQREVDGIFSAAAGIAEVLQRAAQMLSGAGDHMLEPCGLSPRDGALARAQLQGLDQVISRMDMVKDRGAFKLIDFNADAPGLLFETAVVNSRVCEWTGLLDPNAGCGSAIREWLCKSVNAAAGVLRPESNGTINVACGYAERDNGQRAAALVLKRALEGRFPANALPFRYLSADRQAMYDDRGRRVHVLIRTCPLPHLFQPWDFESGVPERLHELVLRCRLGVLNPPSAYAMESKGILAFVFGVTFIVTLLVLSVKFPNPTQFQYTVFRIVLALACAGVAAVIPGVLNVQIGGWLTAGGAFAVFAIVYFYSPANAVVMPPKPTVSIQFTPKNNVGCSVAGGTAAIEVGARGYAAQVDTNCVAEFFDLPVSDVGQNAHVTLSAKSPSDNKAWVLEQQTCATRLSAKMSLAAVNADITPRTTITLLPYAATGAEGRRDVFGEFSDILRDRIVNTVEALKSAHKGLEYLDTLRLCPCDHVETSGNAALMEYWNRTHSLQLWGGALLAAGPEFTVRSRVFSGTLAQTSMPVEMNVTASEFADIRDNHSLVILYALSRDARRLKLADDVVALFLSKTKEVAFDLRARNQTIPPEIEQALQ